jgi:ankyrin repeat protein
MTVSTQRDLSASTTLHCTTVHFSCCSVRLSKRALRTRGDDFTPLHDLTDLAAPFDYSTYEDQLVLAKQLSDHSTNVNAVPRPLGETPLQKACFASNVTHLDFVELLLEEDANPNVQDSLGLTPLMYTLPYPPFAAKFLLNWPITDVYITT